MTRVARRVCAGRGGLGNRARTRKAAKQLKRPGQTTGGRHLETHGNRPAEGKLEKGTHDAAQPTFDPSSFQQKEVIVCILARGVHQTFAFIIV